MKTPLRCEEGFIINSLFQTDFYEFTMGQFVLKNLAGTVVTMEFINRTGIPLGRHIKEADLRRELDHVMTLRFNRSELQYLRRTDELGALMFDESYIMFLQGLKLPPYKLEYHGDIFKLSFTGPFEMVSYWEELAMQIVNELYFRSLLGDMSRFKRDLVFAEGQKRFAEKLEMLKTNPLIVFSDFGTRRAFSAAWHDYLIGIMAEELDESQFRGTSNVYLAMKYGLMPMGTNAHKTQMVYGGLAHSDESLERSTQDYLQAWWDEYGEALAIILPDTFGSEHVFRTLPREEALRWKGFRHDSGDPKKFGDRVIRFYEDHDIAPMQKMIIFSDGLDLETMFELELYFRGRIRVSFGWGTNLTNDLGLKALSIVVKPTFANGRALVKLSDNLAKAMGPESEVERYKRVFGYSNKESAVTVY